MRVSSATLKVHTRGLLEHTFWNRLRSQAPVLSTAFCSQDTLLICKSHIYVSLSSSHVGLLLSLLHLRQPLLFCNLNVAANNQTNNTQARPDLSKQVGPSLNRCVRYLVEPSATGTVVVQHLLVRQLARENLHLAEQAVHSVRFKLRDRALHVHRPNGDEIFLALRVHARHWHIVGLFGFVLW